MYNHGIETDHIFSGESDGAFDGIKRVDILFRSGGWRNWGGYDAIKHLRPLILLSFFESSCVPHTDGQTGFGDIACESTLPVRGSGPRRYRLWPMPTVRVVSEPQISLESLPCPQFQYAIHCYFIIAWEAEKRNENNTFLGTSFFSCWAQLY